MLLSILIPTIPERRNSFERLYNELSKQREAFCDLHWEFIRDFGDIEILYDDSKKFLEGGKSIGNKRGSLIQKASGKYSCFIDDDESVAPNYIESLARLCSQDKDCVTFRCLFKNDTYWALIDMSLRHKKNEDATPHHIIKRRVWHVCPIKREIIVDVAFSEMNHNEDWDWMERVIPHIKSEAHTFQILTQYNHSSEGSEADKIFNAGHK